MQIHYADLPEGWAETTGLHMVRSRDVSRFIRQSFHVEQLRGHVTHCRHCLPLKSLLQRRRINGRLSTLRRRDRRLGTVRGDNSKFDAYAALAVEAGEGRALSLPSPHPISHQNVRSDGRQSFTSKKPTPGQREKDLSRTVHCRYGNKSTVQSDVAADADAITQRVRGYPPLVVESLPNWVSHFEELRRLLGHTPNPRPFGKGVRFLPKSDTEFRTVQRYLQAAARKDNHITWFCYAPVTERPTKIGIRGRPVDTAPDAIITALQELGFPVEYARPIPPRKGRPGCLFYARLGHTNQDGLQRLYGVNTLLNMPGVTIEGWRGRAGPPQCHRCQIFGHSSANCHRPQRCVRCGEGYLAADCPRPRTKNPRAQTANALTRQATRDVRPLEGKLAKEGSRSPPPYQPNRTPLPYTGGIVGAGKRKRLAD
ncbi:Nucleic-acid-binding protein from transposon X-element [Eumeta japonica]|uniref:Nucleic-acid-binding protein from transposon X-element n=1 Tax=Eumeta variegata TaxID=151549 RepID=A0A4C1VEN2_EUMVA|nr:Nucleic-acid-binding protein from transposon X-element [Eumeta japonica]